jgi:hypothetical protein
MRYCSNSCKIEHLLLGALGIREPRVRLSNHLSCSLSALHNDNERCANPMCLNSVVQKKGKALIPLQKRSYGF